MPAHAWTSIQVKCKVTERLAQAFGDTPVQAVHQTAVMECFESGRVDAAIAYLDAHRSTEEKAASAINKLTGYLTRHRAHIPIITRSETPAERSVVG